MITIIDCGTENVKEAKKSFNWEKQESKFLKIYKDLL